MQVSTFLTIAFYNKLLNVHVLTKASTFAFFQYGGLSRALAFMSESAGSFCCISVVPVVPRFPSLGEAEDNEATPLDMICVLARGKVRGFLSLVSIFFVLSNFDRSNDKSYRIYYPKVV